MAALVACLPHQAMTEPAFTHVVSHDWQSTDFRNPAHPGCSIGGSGSAPGGRLMMGASMARPDPVSLVIRKTGWSIPAGTAVQVQVQFADGVLIPLSGVGRDQSIAVDLTGEALVQWVHELTYAAAMEVAFGGAEPAWRFDLAGTTAVVNAMADCLRGHQITGVGAPFAAPTEASAEPAPRWSGTPQFAAAPQLPAYTAPAAALYAARPAASAMPGVQPRSRETVVARWNGSSTLQTRPFHVDGPWELQWTTEGGYFGATLHDAGGDGERTLANGTTAGSSSSYQPKGGDFYLEVMGSRPWSVTVVSLPAPGMPAVSAAPGVSSSGLQGQVAFVATVEEARRQYGNAANGMAKGAARPARARALCQALPSRTVNGWLGRISQLTTNGEGKGVIVIEVGPDVALRTWNNSLSDIGDDTMIDPASPLFPVTAAMHVGQAVRFSARLLPDPTDCFREASMTMAGSIAAPEFIMHLTAIASAE